jgi:hypothetical protein
MSGTLRTPISRRSMQPQITPRALELFVEMERATRARRRADECSVSTYSGYCTTDCPACRKWFDLHAELHTELRLRPWKWPCLPRNPYPPGSPKADDWRPDEEQQKLWGLLDEARRAARRAPAV